MLLREQKTQGGDRGGERVVIPVLKYLQSCYRRRGKELLL